MKKKAVCIRCGTFKKEALTTCPNCNLTPKTDYEAARAFIVSEKFSFGDSDVEIGRSMEELQKIAAAIQNNRPYAIDGEEQKMVVREYYKYLKSLPQTNWPLARKLKWFGTGIAVIVLLVGIVWFLVSRF